VRRKGFALPLIIFFIVVLVILGFVIVKSNILFTSEYSPFYLNIETGNLPQSSLQDQSKTDETANWKTYNDSHLNFQVKYPKDWFIQPALDENSVTILTNYAMPFTGGESNPVADKGKYKVDFAVSTKDKNTSLESYVQDPARLTPDEKLKSKASIFIDGHKAFYIESENQSGDVNASVYVEKEPGTVFIISAGLDYVGFKPTFDQVLETFKFL